MLAGPHSKRIPITQYHTRLIANNGVLISIPKQSTANFSKKGSFLLKTLNSMVTNNSNLAHTTVTDT